MNPRRTARTNAVFELPGGTAENDLPVERVVTDGEVVLRSVWELTPEERQAIAGGANLELYVWARRPPPVALATTTVALSDA